jgi:PPOX class probable F420-dependent enzyme
VPRKIATTDRVDRDALLSFVRDRHHVVLVTRKRDGSPQLSPVTAGVDDGRVVIATYPDRAKVHNLRRDPRASLLVLSDDWDGAWVQCDGTAEVVDLPEAVEPLVGYFRAVAGEHDDWDDYRRAMVDQGKCLLRITIDTWGPIATGGFPPRLVEDGA